MLAAVLSAIVLTLGPFAVDAPNIVEARLACSRLPGYEVFKRVPPGAKVRTDESFESHSAYNLSRYRTVDAQDGTVYGQTNVIRAKGIGPFGELVDGRYAALHPFAPTTSCPFAPTAFNAFWKELRGR
ncbi:hypothetical protein [Ramlibacter alkalitolerans]|uniref:Uncharacterized protein n=1 Tax=Ramlibacter alkalitolerans TaxID=2039631 RepID=A0ABS1JX14_9BURK|nr:hypothetical protein [Ramlibacter alkalitolerans]MBL0428732.1 hypothetical protein [Ramlibacter alkalitolerans]